MCNLNFIQSLTKVITYYRSLKRDCYPVLTVQFQEPSLQTLDSRETLFNVSINMNFAKLQHCMLILVCSTEIQLQVITGFIGFVSRYDKILKIIKFKLNYILFGF